MPGGIVPRSAKGSSKIDVKNLTRLRFGTLVVLGRAGKNGGLWLCQCDCGQKLVVVEQLLTSGATTSCGRCHDGNSEQRPPEQYPREKGGSTLCWGCKKATGGCSWSRFSEPVEGWQADATTISGSHMPMKSFIVRACPEFERD